METIKIIENDFYNTHIRSSNEFFFQFEITKLIFNNIENSKK